MIVNPLTKQDTPYDLFFAGGAVSPSVLTDMVTRWTCKVVKAGNGNVIQIRVFRRRWQRQPGEVAVDSTAKAEIISGQDPWAVHDDRILSR